MGMEFTLRLRGKDGKGGSSVDTHTLESMREELAALSGVLDVLVVGETIEIRRTA